SVDNKYRMEPLGMDQQVVEQPIQQQRPPLIPPRLHRRPINDEIRPLPPLPPLADLQEPVADTRSIQSARPESGTVWQRVCRILTTCRFIGGRSNHQRDYRRANESEISLQNFERSGRFAYQISRQSGHYPCMFDIKQIKQMPWYFGPLNSADVTRILAGRPNGSFIVRESPYNLNVFYLCLLYNGLTFDTKIVCESSVFHLSWRDMNIRSRTNLTDLIDYLVRDSRSVRSANTCSTRYLLPQPTADGPLKLAPLSRNSVLPSLKHLCRFEIMARIRGRQLGASAAVGLLPLPNSLQQYLLVEQYFVENVSQFELQPLPQSPIAQDFHQVESFYE
ncbi:hypothetical protein BOX15_Mlig001242g2, partial [Macrostomum lignano]